MKLGIIIRFFVRSVAVILILAPVVFAQAFAPEIIPGATSVNPDTINRFGPVTTEFSVDFTDLNQPGADAFLVTFRARSQTHEENYLISDAYINGQNGMVITDNGGGSYTAAIAWDPPDSAILGFYDLYCLVSDSMDFAEDSLTNNLDELFIASGGENSPPVVKVDITVATPPGIERIGVNSTVISSRFTDLDLPGVSAFTVTFKLRFEDLSEIILADSVGNGAGGIIINDLSGGLYEAAISWDPPDVQPLGFYDLYFRVTDGIGFSIDGFENNLDELQVYDAVSNKPPGLVSDTTRVVPDTVNRLGSEYTMLKSVFWDGDFPGSRTFTVTFKVRNPNLVETVVVNSAGHGEQGLRIVPLHDSLYKATVLWNPPDTAETGAYDLYFELADNNSAVVIDDYTANAGELAVTSNPIPGNGHLLRRSNNGDNCGGPNSACHNLANHQTYDCVSCHDPHGTPNIYMVRDTIQTPNSGPREVVLKALGIGDPFNPDPVIGDPNSGVLADSTDGVFTGICEVCHTTTGHHRNDGSQPPPNHNDAVNCTICHPHSAGFAVSGGGESSGGNGCFCHTNILPAMQDNTASSYHHLVLSDNADYSVSSRTCLMCHVHHDIFRPDLNTGFGSRGSNLRVDTATSVVQGSAAVLTNTDYLSTGTGGICLSCHTSTQTKSFTQPDSSTQTPVINKTFFDQSTSGHNYTVSITFNTDGSVFNANCSKCHNDNIAKSFQSSTFTVSTHDSDIRSIIDTLGSSTPSNPMEETLCFRCHSTTSNPNAGSNQDYYGVKPMGAPALAIESEFNRTYTHPIGNFSGIHLPVESPSAMTRHVECEDCHNPHAAAAGGTGLPNSLRGVTGIDTSGAFVLEVSNSYETCFKCHGDQNNGNQFIVRDDGSSNTRLEFSPNALSYHPVTAVGKNPNVPSLISPWTESSIMTCVDCHASDGSSSPGPHGSQYNPILKLRYDTGDNLSESSARYALCYSCHNRNSILNNNSWTEHNRHINGENAPCSICHDPHGLASVGVGSGAHLVSFDLSVVSAVNGRIEFLDSGTNRPTCWLRCHGQNHDGWN